MSRLLHPRSEQEARDAPKLLKKRVEEPTCVSDKECMKVSNEAPSATEEGRQYLQVSRKETIPMRTLLISSTYACQSTI